MIDKKLSSDLPRGRTDTMIPRPLPSGNKYDCKIKYAIFDRVTTDKVTYATLKNSKAVLDDVMIQ